MSATQPAATLARPRRALASPLQRLGLHHLALAGVLALSAVLNVHRLSQNGYGNIFYSAGVKSMLRSWHNFFFVSFDPGGFVTVDKPPLGFWVETLSAALKTEVLLVLTKSPCRLTLPSRTGLEPPLSVES